MSISAVERSIRDIRAVIREWDGLDLGHWAEVHTKYGVIDPIIRSLGWKTDDPKECYPEYTRYVEGQARWADYALFGRPNMRAIGNYEIAPDVIIESKPLRSSLANDVRQLQSYAETDPKMRTGVAVLTNGGEWWLYDVSKRGTFANKLVDQVNILEGSQRTSAQVLNRWLGRSGFG